MIDLISDAVRDASVSLHQRFVSAKPYRHVVIDEFFEDGIARELVAQFPPFDGRYAINEMGKVGRKAVFTALSELGPAYRRIDRFFGSRSFLDWIGGLTGIPDLLYDAENFGGGTHENLEGQDLAPHVDFNYHPKTHHHRRLNLIVYLNEGWQPEWGGNIAVHSNPRDPANDCVKAYAPILNRCIVFETNEYSWHGFDRIALPEDRKDRSRKSLSIYLYTRERPEPEIYSTHATFYVPQPLPAEIRAGKTLTEADVQAIADALRARDELIEWHQSFEAARDLTGVEANRNLMLLHELLHNARLPLLGYVKQLPGTSGWYGDADGWAGPDLAFKIEPELAVAAFTLYARIPDRMPEGTAVCISIDGNVLCERSVEPGPVVLRCDAPLPPGRPATIRIATSNALNLRALGISEDRRDLALVVERVVFDHA